MGADAAVFARNRDVDLSVLYYEFAFGVSDYSFPDVLEPGSPVVIEGLDWELLVFGDDDLVGGVLGVDVEDAPASDVELLEGKPRILVPAQLLRVAG